MAVPCRGEADNGRTPWQLTRSSALSLFSTLLSSFQVCPVVTPPTNHNVGRCRRAAPAQFPQACPEPCRRAPSTEATPRFETRGEPRHADATRDPVARPRNSESELRAEAQAEPCNGALETQTHPLVSVAADPGSGFDIDLTTGDCWGLSNAPNRDTHRRQPPPNGLARSRVLAVHPHEVPTVERPDSDAGGAADEGQQQGQLRHLRKILKR